MEHMALIPRYSVRATALRSLLATQGRRKDWLAKQAGIHPSLLSHVMAGRRTVSSDVAERIAGALQVPLSLAFVAVDGRARFDALTAVHADSAAVAATRIRATEQEDA